MHTSDQPGAGLATSPPHLPERLQALVGAGRFRGEVTLLDGRRRVLLISRTPRHPTPGTPWVRRVVEAAGRSVACGEVLLCGAQRTAHQVALAECRRRNGAAIVCVEESLFEGEPRRGIEALLPRRHLLICPGALELPMGGELAGVPRRDGLLAWWADCAWLIEARRGGHMERLAGWLEAHGLPVERVSGQAGPSASDVLAGVTAGSAAGAAASSGVGGTVGPAAGVADGRGSRSVAAEEVGALFVGQGLVKGQATGPGQVAGGVRANSGAQGWELLTHFTREPEGAWPGETQAAYAGWLAGGLAGERRGPFEALGRILEERTIRASGRLMPGAAPMVCFTACRPDEVTPLIRWRRGLGRWTFRPYGLAIPVGLLAGMGARPVRYLDGSAQARLSPEERRFSQRLASRGTDWSMEREWRLAGDLDLGPLLERGGVLALLPTRQEAEAVASRFSLPVRVLGAGSH